MSISLRDRMQRSDPMWRKLVERSDTMFRVLLVSGGTAGDHTVTGIREGDKLVSVLHYTPATSFADLTSEFIGKDATTGNGAIIAADDTINNTGGTDTSSDQLLVVWEAYDVR